MSTGKSVKLLGCLLHQRVSGRPFCQTVRAVRGFRVFHFSKVMWALRKKLNAWKHVRIRHCSTWPGRKLPKSRRLLPAHRTVLYSCILTGFQLRFTIKQRSYNATLLTTNATFNKELVVDTSSVSCVFCSCWWVSFPPWLCCPLGWISAFRQSPYRTCKTLQELTDWQSRKVPGSVRTILGTIQLIDWLIDSVDKYINNWLVKWHLHAFYLKVLM